MKITRKYTLGIIGLGHMGTAIARGAVRKEYIERYKIAVYDHSEHAKNDCRIEGFDKLTIKIVDELGLGDAVVLLLVGVSRFFNSNVSYQLVPLLKVELDALFGSHCFKLLTVDVHVDASECPNLSSLVFRHFELALCLINISSCSKNTRLCG